MLGCRRPPRRGLPSFPAHRRGSPVACSKRYDRQRTRGKNELLALLKNKHIFPITLLLLQRRRNPQKGKNPSSTPAQNFPWDTTESRPLVKSVSREAGEDYWMDQDELAKFEQQQQAIQNRKAMEGEVPKEKLWTEVKAPYKQNWIGYFSVAIAILSAIVIKFPELLDQPTIPIPDL